jgi:hypothetical protein
MGLCRHYGVVVQAGYMQEPVIRTVLSSRNTPVNLSASAFSEGKPIYVIPYPSQCNRWEVVQNALHVLSFDYCLLTNNCEHFYKKVHGLNPVSFQVLLAGAALIGYVVLSAATKNSLPVKV